jgi:alkylation response protein AidB-like acyl-CoA dehydrogenase
MNFDFSPEQKQLKDEARRLLARECTPQKIRAVLDDPLATHDGALWKTVAGQGWTASAIPESYGGLGLGYLELCCIAEELGRALAPIPFASTVYFFSETLLRAGSDAQKRHYLSRVASGEMIGCFASAEAPGPVTPASIAAEVKSDRLTGRKRPVTDGGIADEAVVLAKEGGVLSLFLVDLKGPGVARVDLETIDPTRNAAELVFDGAPIERLGAAGEGLALMAQIFDRAAILIAFEQVGGADRCLEMARDYARGRYAFGRPIGSYQAIKHKLADVYIKTVLARSNAYYGAWALNAGAPELPIAAAGARIAACDAYWLASKENIQTHGGMGYTWEADCHLYYRRARQLALVAGAPLFWKERLIAALQRPNAA